MKFEGGVLQAEKIDKPSLQKESYPSFSGEVPCIQFNYCNEIDQTWALCQVVNEDISGTLPTWPAFNSLISLKSSPTTCQGLPLYPSPPTDWSTLYTTLKIVQGINVEVTGERKTII